MKKIISTDNAPAAIGPYSQANQIGNTIYVSGQLPLVPGTKEFAGEGIADQTRQSLSNAKAILQAAGFEMTDVVKVTVLLDDITDFAGMNEVYGEFSPRLILQEQPSKWRNCRLAPRSRLR